MPAAKPLGRPRGTDLRAIVDAILYMARTGCQWRLLPKDFPPFTTVQGYFYDWRDGGLFERINFELLLEVREAAVREASPKPAPLKNGGRGHRQPIGQDHRERRAARWSLSSGAAQPRPGGRRQEGQKPAPAQAGGRKRHIVTDTTGLMVAAAIHPAPVLQRGRLYARPRWCATRCRSRP